MKSTQLTINSREAKFRQSFLSFLNKLMNTAWDVLTDEPQTLRWGVPSGILECRTLVKYGSIIWNFYLKKKKLKKLSIDNSVWDHCNMSISRQKRSAGIATIKIREQELDSEVYYIERALLMCFRFQNYREVCLKLSRWWIFRPINGRRSSSRILMLSYGGLTTASLQHSFFWRACHLIKKLPFSFINVRTSTRFRKLIKPDVLAW